MNELKQEFQRAQQSFTELYKIPEYSYQVILKTPVKDLYLIMLQFAKL